MLGKILRALERQRLVKAGQRILVAVSGGSDSVALLLALHELKYPLVVAHLNHGIRGREADRDEKFVRQIAARLGAPFVSGRCNVPALARKKKISIEMAAREARQKFFREAASKRDAAVVATAHTADDQVETVLMRLFRGAGSDGVSGMDWRSDIGHLHLIRPMLEVTREEAREYLRERRQRWREDASNKSPDYMRNRIRHEILPMLERRVNPAVRTAVVRWAEITKADNASLNALAAGPLRRLAASDSLSVKQLTKLDAGLQRRAIREWLERREVTAYGNDFDAVERVRALAASGKSTGEAPLSSNTRVLRRYDHIALAGPAKISAFKKRLAVPGNVSIPALGLNITSRRSTGILKPAHPKIGVFPAEATLSSAAVRKSPVYVRSWRDGDRIKPLGMVGTRKLQDIFADAKISREERMQIPVFECRGEIIWLPGYRVARGWEVESAKAPCLRIILKK